MVWEKDNLIRSEAKFSKMELLLRDNGIYFEHCQAKRFIGVRQGQ